MGDRDSSRAGHRDRRRSDRGALAHRDEEPTVTFLIVDQSDQGGFSIGQSISRFRAGPRRLRDGSRGRRRFRKSAQKSILVDPAGRAGLDSWRPFLVVK